MTPTTPTVPPGQTLTQDQAVRLALSATGLTGSPGPGPGTDRGHVRRLVGRLGALQIDSVNVLARAHLLPVRSRLGDYDRRVLDRATSTGPGRRPVAWEYWGHEASFVGAEALSALRWRMREAEAGAWSGMVEVARRRPELLDAVVDVLADGPLTARQLQQHLEPGHTRRTDHWGWNWSDVKRAVEFAFWSGRVASAGRTEQFERRYDRPERVWPVQALTTPWPGPDEAADVLVDLAGRAQGVGTLADLRDHFRLPPALARDAVTRLVEAGRLLPVQVQGWGAGGGPAPAWRHVDVALPRASSGWDGAGTLLAPFDPLVWHRPRVERLFGFRYRLEIYVPAARRVHGYYVLPFLHRGRLVARVDLKADRARGVLQVRSAWAEPGADGDDVVALGRECARLGRWCGCDRVEVEPVGDAATALADAVRATAGADASV
ncbi:winged helix-turn-helix domain-containing protein [Aquipuribacter sp. MA13-6]|uniref:winged helix-turn-helix domain-containing protein n=1 Tax=unclassified Aquipuribacter TaxID=2635084 RepID=UPI003EEFCDCB